MSEPGHVCETAEDCKNSLTQLCLDPALPNPFFYGNGTCGCRSTNGLTGLTEDGCMERTGTSYLILALVFGLFLLDVWAFHNAQKVFRALPEKQRFKTVGVCLIFVCFAIFSQGLYHITTRVPEVLFTDKVFWDEVNQFSGALGASFSIAGCLLLPLMWIKLVRSAQMMTKTGGGGHNLFGKTKLFLQVWMGGFFIVYYGSQLMLSIRVGDAKAWYTIAAFTSAFSSLVSASTFKIASGRI